MSITVSNLESFLAQLIVERLNRNLRDNGNANVNNADADPSPSRRGQIVMPHNGFPEDHTIQENGDGDRWEGNSPTPGVDQPLAVEVDEGLGDPSTTPSSSSNEQENQDHIVVVDEEEDDNLNHQWNYGLFDCLKNMRNCLWGTFCPSALLNHTGERVGMKHGLINLVNGCLSWIAFPCWLAYVRNLTRKKLGLGGTAKEDIACALCCTLCTNCQMSNETEHLDRQNFCCDYRYHGLVCACCHARPDLEDDLLDTPPPNAAEQPQQELDGEQEDNQENVVQNQPEVHVG